MAVDGIIFDMDGTVWDTVTDVAECWNYGLEKHGQEIRVTANEIAGCMGLAMEKFAAKLLPTITDEDLRREILYTSVGYENEYLEVNATEEKTLYPKVLDTMRALSEKYPLYIVSNCQAGYIEAFLKRFDFADYIVDFENPMRTGFEKGANIKIICERHELKNPVYIGDTQGDMQACKEAGVRFVFAAYGFGEVDSADYDARLEKFEDLPELLADL